MGLQRGRINQGSQNSGIVLERLDRSLWVDLQLRLTLWCFSRAVPRPPQACPNHMLLDILGNVSISCLRLLRYSQNHHVTTASRPLDVRTCEYILICAWLYAGQISNLRLSPSNIKCDTTQSWNRDKPLFRTSLCVRERQKMLPEKTISMMDPGEHATSDAPRGICYTGLDLDLNVPHPSKLQRHLLLLVIRLVGHFRGRTGSVLMLSKDLCVKYGQRTNLVEAQTMVFVARNTTLPVPKVHCAFVHKGCTYILMERINGQPLGKSWMQRSPASKLMILECLKKLVSQMRCLHTDSNRIRSVTGGSLYDPRMPTTAGRFGPFEDVQQFHCHLRHGIQAHSNHDADITKLIILHSGDWDAPTFTHGDLSSLNILVRGDDVVGIIDWETAGWYPSYWEYTTACQVNPQNSFWRDEIDKFLVAMPEALAMEHLRQKYFGDF